MPSQTRLAALQYRDFRLMWVAELASASAAQMTTFAVNWHIFQLLAGQTITFNLLGAEIQLGAEALGLGGLGLARILPMIAFSLLGGMLADAYDRRKLMALTRVFAALLVGALAAFTLTGQATVPIVYLFSALAAGLSDFDTPARQSLVPRLVRPEHLVNAISLQTIIWQLATIAGPAAAGVLVGALENTGALAVGWIYTLTAGLFLISLTLILQVGVQGTAGGQTLSWQALLEGVRFTFSARIIRGTMLLDFLATLAASARTMLPIVATDILGLGAAGYGLLATAQPVGALLANSFIALRRDIRRQGLVMLIGVALYGTATALFGLSTHLALSYILFALTGVGDTISTILRSAIRQTMTPDRLRGRMTGVNMLFASGGPQLGELRAGLVAAAWGVPFAITSGGIAAVLLTLWIAWRYPRLRQYTAQSTPMTASD
jgi:MFS family permease